MSRYLLGDRISLVYHYRTMRNDRDPQTIEAGELIVGQGASCLVVGGGQKIEVHILPGIIGIVFAGEGTFSARSLDFVFTNHTKDFPKTMVRSGIQDDDSQGRHEKYLVAGNTFTVSMEAVKMSLPAKLEFGM